MHGIKPIVQKLKGSMPNDGFVEVDNTSHFWPHGWHSLVDRWGRHKCTHLFAFEFLSSQHVTYEAAFYSQPHVTHFQYNFAFSEQVL